MPENSAEKPGEVTLLLHAARRGDTEALTKIIPLVYDELRMLAQKQIQLERPDTTYQATALVHEAYLRLIDQNHVEWQDRQHFLAVAATMMRRILVNHAREQQALEQGGGRKRVARRGDGAAASTPAPVDLVELDEALAALESRDGRIGRVVEMRFFGGMSFKDIADHLDVHPTTAKRYWKAAKLLLLDALSTEDE